MRNISPSFKEAALLYRTERQLTIKVYDDYDPESGTWRVGTRITNANIVSESMKITQSLCDDADIRFGGACANSFEIDIFGYDDLTGRYITVELSQTVMRPTFPSLTTFPGETYPGCSPLTDMLNIFSGEIYSCKLDKARITRRVVAYDRFYWRGNIDCAAWYTDTTQSFWHNISQTERYYTTVGELRKAICAKYSIVEEYPLDVLPVDSMEVQLVENVGNITVAHVLHSICELCGVYCLLNGNGNLEYHTLSDNSDITGIRKAGTEAYEKTYADCDCEEFTKEYTGLAWLGTDGHWYGYASNNSFYVLTDENIIMTSFGGYTSWEIEMETIWQDVINYIHFDPITPMTLKAPYRSWVEIGDKITFKIRDFVSDGNGGYAPGWKTVSSVILNRTITGIQAMTDEFSTNAENIRISEETIYGDV